MLNSPQLLGWTAQLQGFNCWTFPSRLRVFKYANPSHRLQPKALCPLLRDLLTKSNLYSLPPTRDSLLFPASSVPTFLHPPRQATVLWHGKRQCPPSACAVSPTGHSSSSQPLLTGHLQLILQGVNKRSSSLLGSLPVIRHKLLGGRNHVTLIYCCIPSVYENAWPFVGTQ